MIDIKEFLEWLREKKEVELCYLTDDCDSPWVEVKERYLDLLITQFKERDQ